MQRNSMSQTPASTAKFKCSVCSRAFSRRDHLARHERGHNKSRPFSCGLCGRRFGRRDVLLRHSSSVHRGRRPCEYEHVQVDDAHETSASHPRPSSPPLPSASKGSEQLVELESAATTEYIRPTIECVDTVGESAVSTPSVSSADSGLSKIAAFGESDLDGFLDLLLSSPSYTDVAQTLSRMLPNNDSTILSRTASCQTGRDWSSRVTPQGYAGVPDNIKTGAVSSFHDGLFPPGTTISTTKTTGLPTHLQLTYQPQRCLTQPIFDQLLRSYKRHSATIRPFLHFQTLDVSLHSLLDDSAQRTRSAHGPSCTRWKRQPHRCLVLSVLALGAICDREESLALELYHQTRKEILDWLARLGRLGAEGEPPLDLIQALVNYVCCGTKFGNKSIEDLTVGHSVSLRNLAQGMILDQPASRPPLGPALSTCMSCSANAAPDWLGWAYYEERKRTVLAYFALMSSTLIYLDTVTSIDWREVKHRMPCSDWVWAAETPSTWRAAFRYEPVQPFFTAEVESLFTGAPNRPTAQGSSSPVASPSAEADGTQVVQSTTREHRRDYACFILVAAVYRETWLRSLQNAVDFEATQTALHNWQANWLRLAPQEEDLHTATPLFDCSLAMFNITQLLLRLDVQEAKAALVSRQYGRFCVTLLACNLRLDSEGSGCCLLSGRDDWQQTYDIFSNTDQRMAFHHAALYSMNALELTFRVHSRSALASTGLSFTPHTGTAVFYCVQLLTSWICFFSNCLDRGLYTEWLGDADNNQECQDIRLLQKILAFTRRRRTQFGANFHVPSSPHDCDRLSVGKLASDLLELHSRLFLICGTWPGMPLMTPFSPKRLAVKNQTCSVQEPWRCTESSGGYNLGMASEWLG